MTLVQVAVTPAVADTIEAALVRAYQTNPQLNAQRASVRATDENVPQALSGYRPRVSRHRQRRLSIYRLDGHIGRRTATA